MTSEQKYEYWLAHARYDLTTASSMFDTGRWFYVVFMCQQAVGKIVKGLYTLYVNDNVPHIHNIQTIFDRFSGALSAAVPAEIYRLFGVLSGYYISNRYPDFENTPDSSVDKNTAEMILKQTKEAVSWLMTLKK
jgi:HEPN domain-containing protein